jgi:hypothetical protein
MRDMTPHRVALIISFKEKIEGELDCPPLWHNAIKPILFPEY